MATFAQLNPSNIVTNLILVDDHIVSTERDGINYCRSLFGLDNYVQTFPDNSQRRRYARVGDYYDITTDAFYVGDIAQDNQSPVKYINLPNGTSYCVIFRNASSLFTGLIGSTYFNLPVSKNLSARNILQIPNTSSPVGLPYAIIRDPIERFISSYALTTGGVPAWLPVDKFIDWLVKQDKAKLNSHFMPQVNLVGSPVPSDIIYFDFAADLNPMAGALGLPTPLPIVNATNPDNKPVLTPDQISILENFYSEDIALYNKIRKV